jgi:hypothetical protein
MNGPAMDGSVIDGDAALGYHLFQVPEAKIVSQVPADAEQDHDQVHTRTAGARPAGAGKAP